MTGLLTHAAEARDAVESLDWEVVRDDVHGLDLWQSLDEQLGNDFVTCSCDWVRTWVQVFGDGLPHRYLVARRASEPVGIALLVESVRYAGPIPIRTLHLGTAGEADHDSVCVEDNRPLVDPQFEAPFFAGLWQHVESDRRWDSFRSDGLTAEVLPALNCAHSPAETRAVPSHYFDLMNCRTNGRTLLDQLGQSTRRSIKQSLKQLGPLTIDWSESVTEAQDIFADLIRLHQARWTAIGEPGCYASAHFTRFHWELLHRWVPQRRMVLTRVRRGSETLGCAQLFVERNRLLLYQCGSTRVDPKVSAGLITDYLSMQASLERGYDAYDFLAGDTVHKRKLSTHARKIHWLTWNRPRWKFPAAEMLRAFKRRFLTVRGATGGLSASAEP